MATPGHAAVASRSMQKLTRSVINRAVINRAVITGASSGIGHAIASQLANQNQLEHLVLVARRRDHLEELARHCQRPGLQIDIRTCDLGNRKQRTHFAEELATQPTDLLVCAAGFGADGFFDTLDVARMEEMVEVNLLAAMHLTRAVLPGMLERNHGQLVMVGSGAGVWPMQKTTAYAATKAGMHGFCEALRMDLKGTNIHVTEALPGPVDTEFDQAAGLEHGMDSPAAGMKIGAHTCAADILAATNAHQEVVYPGKKYNLLMRFSDTLPRPVARKIARRSGDARWAQG